MMNKVFCIYMVFTSLWPWCRQFLHVRVLYLLDVIVRQLCFDLHHWMTSISLYLDCFLTAAASSVIQRAIWYVCRIWSFISSPTQLERVVLFHFIRGENSETLDAGTAPGFQSPPTAPADCAGVSPSQESPSSCLLAHTKCPFDPSCMCSLNRP